MVDDNFNTGTGCDIPSQQLLFENLQNVNSLHQLSEDAAIIFFIVHSN